MPETEADEGQQAYDVTIFNPGDPRAGVSSAFVETVDAASEDAAREQVVASGSAPTADDVIEAKPKKVRLRVEVTGTTDQMADAMDEFERTAEFSEGVVSFMDEDRYVHLEAGDDDDAELYAVEEWRNAVMRVTGLSEAIQGEDNADGMDVDASSFAGAHSTVEFMVGDKVLAKVTKEGGNV